MGKPFIGNRFYWAMGVVLLTLVIVGFGTMTLIRGLNPFDLPLLFHLHGLSFMAWYCLFIYQATLIGNNNRQLHIKLGQLSLIIVVTMLVSGWFMARGSFERGISLIPGISVEQFIAFPFFDLVGLLVFYTLAVAKRGDAEFHKRAMLLTSLAIIDPAVARIGIAVGFPPFPVVACLLLIAAIMWHDRKVLGRIHGITWFGFVWIFLRLGFVFGFAASDLWAVWASTMFG